MPVAEVPSDFMPTSRARTVTVFRRADCEPTRGATRTCRVIVEASSSSTRRGVVRGVVRASDDGLARARASRVRETKRTRDDRRERAVRGAFARRRDAESARSRCARRDEVFATRPIETARVRERASRAYLRDARAAAEGGGLARLDGDGGGERGDGGHGGGDVDACTWSGGARIGDTSAARRSSRAVQVENGYVRKVRLKRCTKNVNDSIKRRRAVVFRRAVPRWLSDHAVSFRSRTRTKRGNRERSSVVTGSSRRRSFCVA